MIIKQLYILVSLLLFGNLMYSQDKIQLMNGKVLEGKIGKEYDGYYDFSFSQKNGTTKTMEVTRFRTFSVTDSKGIETILYKQDSLIGNVFTVPEMKMYIYGQKDARNGYNGKPIFLTSMALGLGTVLYDTYGSDQNPGFFNRKPSMAPIAVPFLITIGAGVIKSKVKKLHATDPVFLASEQYIEGYQKVMKFNRVKSAFLGSVIGVAAGFVTYAIAK